MRKAELAKLTKQIQAGSDETLKAIKEISKGQPLDGIFMLMVTAVSLAKAIKMPWDVFIEGIELTWDDIDDA
jgi:predicted secreted Zn-dependent protease